MFKKFKDLTEKEILAMAIASEEEDSRIFGEFADALRETYPATAKMFEEMRAEEVVHRDRLLAMFRQRFGDHIPLIRRENVKGFLQRRPVWLVRPLGVKAARKQAEVMEMEAARFYSRAASRTTDAPTRELLNKLGDEERKHEQRRKAGRETFNGACAGAGRRIAPQIISSAGCTARALGVDRWVDLNTRTAFCHSICNT